jgi:hypothetical protein
MIPEYPYEYYSILVNFCSYKKLSTIVVYFWRRVFEGIGRDLGNIKSPLVRVGLFQGKVFGF